MGTNEVCVVVPVHNEALILGAVVRGLLEHFPHIVCVDDGSVDGSAEVAVAAGAVVLRHGVNLGQGAALQTGFDYVLRYTSAEHVVTFDGDGQHCPSDAARLVSAARGHGVDVVLGSRHGGQVIDQPRGRMLLLRAGVVFTRLSTGLPVTDTHNGLRVLSRRALTRLRLTQSNMAHASELLNAIRPSELSWMEVPVTIRYTQYSRSKGQRGMNAFNVVYDLIASRLRANS